MSKPLGTDDLLWMAWSAQDMNKEVHIQRSEVDEELILYIVIDGEEFHNDLFEDEMWSSDHKEVDRNYYG